MKTITHSSVSRLRLIAGSGTLLVLFGVAGCSTPATNAGSPAPYTAVPANTAVNVSPDPEVIAPPPSRADVMPPFHSVANKVNVSIGKSVEKGDILVELQMPSQEALHEQTKAALKAAETAYANARNQYSSSVDVAQKQLDAARAAEKTAQAAASSSNPDNTTPPPTTDLTQATNDRLAAEQALKLAIADRDTQILPYKQQLDDARAANQQARAGEKMGNIRTPISGTVLALNAQPGKEVGLDAKLPVATIVDLSALQVHAPLSKEQATTVKTKMPVELTFADLPGKTFNGKVSQITSQMLPRMGGLSKEARMLAIIEFKNTDALVKPGMKPTVTYKAE